MEPCRALELRLVLPIMLLLLNSSAGMRTQLRGASSTDTDEKGGADVYYAAEVLDKFRTFAIQQQSLTDYRHRFETQRLQGAIAAAASPTDKALLQETVEHEEQSRMEAQNAYREMLNFANTIKAVAMRSTGGARTCDEITCGQFATCEVSKTTGATCKCETGFKGDGFACLPPATFTALPLLVKTDHTPNILDINLAVFSETAVAVAYRDSAKDNKGYLMVGHAGLALVEWGKPVVFSASAKAFAPVVAGLAENKLFVAYRDEEKGGNGVCVAGEVTSPKELTIRVSKPEVFARNQDDRMALVQLPHSRVALMYSEKVVDAEGEILESWGGAMLAQVNDVNSTDAAMLAPPEILGKYRFSDLQVSKLDATLLSSTQFVVAYNGKFITADGEKPPFKEASVIYAQMDGSELLFSPHPISLEPNNQVIQDRGVALVSANLFAYSYYSGVEQETKMTVVKIDPETHQMVITDGPRVLSKGPNRYVQSISVPFGGQAPHTFTYYGQPGKKGSTAQICRVSQQGRIADCEEKSWAGYDIRTVSGAVLWDGRLIFVFANEAGQPFYQMEGLFVGNAPKEAEKLPGR